MILPRHLLLVVLLKMCISAGPDCTDDVDGGLYVAHYQKALIGHTFLSRSATSRIQCVVLCSRHSRCMSVNFEDTSGTCQLNSERKEEFPESLQQDVGFSYFGRLSPRPQRIENITTMDMQLSTDPAEDATPASSTESCVCHPLGMESGAIMDHQIVAADVNGDVATFGPTLARLNSESAWCGASDSTWIQVTFDQTVGFCSLIVQGHASGSHVYGFTLSFDAEANWSSFWKQREFDCRAVTTQDVLVQLPHVVRSIFIRIQPTDVFVNRCMRFEILGCP